VKIKLGFSLIFTNCIPGDMTSFQYRIIMMSTRRITRNSYVIFIMLIGKIHNGARVFVCKFATFQIRGLLMLKFDYFCNYCIGSLGSTSNNTFWVYFLLFSNSEIENKTMYIILPTSITLTKI